MMIGKSLLIFGAFAITLACVAIAAQADELPAEYQGRWERSEVWTASLEHIEIDPADREQMSIVGTDVRFWGGSLDAEYEVVFDARPAVLSEGIWMVDWSPIHDVSGLYPFSRCIPPVGMRVLMAPEMFLGVTLCKDPPCLKVWPTTCTHSGNTYYTRPEGTANAAGSWSALKDRY